MLSRPLLIAASLAGLAPAAQAQVFPYEVHSKTLDNGLTIHIAPTPNKDVVAFYTWMAVGSRDEIDPGRTGFAHFFEHLMFYGTESLGGADREDEILRLGIEENAWTWLDETVYHGVLSTKNLDRYIEIEADRFKHLMLTEEDVKRESGAVYGEFRKGQANPSEALSVALQAEAFRVHTYGHDTIGYEADIQAMPTAHAYSGEFFDRFYRPENATILVVGDVDPEATFAKIEQHWADWERGTTPRPTLEQEPPQEELRRVHVDWPTATSAELTMAWKIPEHDPTLASTAQLALVEDLLLSTVSPLQERLVRSEGLAYSVGGGRDQLVDPGLFRVSVSLKDPSKLTQVEAIIREELAALGEHIDQANLDRTRDHTRYAFLSSLDSPGAVADALGGELRRSGDPKAFDAFFEHYLEATPEDISQAIATYFVDEHLTIATLTPPEEAAQ